MTNKNFKINFIILIVFSFILIALGLYLDGAREVISGLYKIILCSDVLLVDYLAIGGIGATFVNSGLLLLLCTILVSFLNLELTGPLIAGLLTVCGFAFMGKNILNVWPIFLGGFIYSHYRRIEFKSILLVLLFTTALAPVVTFVALGMGFELYISIPLAIVVGSVIGFVVPPMTAQMLKIHDGYNLYNIGFTCGILGTLIAGSLRAFGFPMETQSILSTEYSVWMRNFLIISSTVAIILGYLMNNKSFKGYKKLFKLSGRLVTNFPVLVGNGVTFINIGIMGLISISYVILVGGVFDGPVIAGVLTVAGFAAFGKHPKNSIPIMFGIFLAGLLTNYDLSSTPIVIAALFGTTLAPIAGGYGTIPGIVAGFLHLVMVTHSGKFHGGLDLYNNGFSGGLVAAIMVPILNATMKKKIDD